MRTTELSVCKAGLDNRLIGPVPVFYPVILFMANNMETAQCEIEGQKGANMDEKEWLDSSKQMGANNKPGITKRKINSPRTQCPESGIRHSADLPHCRRPDSL